MSYSKATLILKRKILFGLLQKLNLDNCIRCDAPMTADDWSLDHKEPWVDVSPDLFWAEENIGFSHKVCNQLARRRPMTDGQDYAVALMQSPEANEKRKASLANFYDSERSKEIKSQMSKRALKQWAPGGIFAKLRAEGKLKGVKKHFGSGGSGQHARWHVNRNIVNPNCPDCCRTYEGVKPL